MIEDRISRDNMGYKSKQIPIKGFKIDETQFLKEAMPPYRSAKQLAVWHLINARYDNALDILTASRGRLELEGNYQDRTFHDIMEELVYFFRFYEICVKQSVFPDKIKTYLKGVSERMSRGIQEKLLKEEDRKVVMNDFYGMLSFIKEVIDISRPKPTTK